MPLGMEVGLGPGDFVLHGTLLPLPKKVAEPPKFSAHVYCGQTAACIKMPLGIELGLGPGDFVRWGSRCPFPKRGVDPQNFRPMFIVTKRLHGWMKLILNWHGCRHPIPGDLINLC